MSTTASNTSNSSNDQNIKLSETEKKIVESVLSHKNVFFTGAAGTGKSFLLNFIIYVLKTMYSEYEIGITASTGITAINVGGCTLHSFLGLGLAIGNIDTLINKIRELPSAINRWRNTKVLIIDEISMIDGEFFDKVEYIARYVRGNNLPFGGIQIIATGDFYQLQPVNNKKLCFESRVWYYVFNEVIELTEIYRQKDFKFQKILNEVRCGEISPETEMELQRLERKVNCPEGIIPTSIFTLRSDVDKENRKRLSQLNGESKFFRCEDYGNESLLDQLKKYCPAPEILELKVGAQVCLTKSLDNYFVCGSVGLVKGFTEENYPKVYFPVLDRLITVVPEEWTIFKTENGNKIVKGKRIQIPLVLAWAISIHKSQGQALKFIRADLLKISEYGQAYVALSRAIDMDGLQIVNYNRNRIKTNIKVKQFSNFQKQIIYN